MSNDIFIAKVSNLHPSWRALFDSDNEKEKDLCVELYSKFKSYSDRDFVNKFQTDFYSPFWEMDLACTFTDSGFNLSEDFSGDEGPDLCIINDFSENRIWIEAVCPTRGTNSDEVSLGKTDQVNIVDSKKIMLRLTSAIRDKSKKHISYLDKGICQNSEPFIIAINGSLLTPGPGLDDITPRIVKAVFEGGHDELLLDRNTGTHQGRQVDYCPAITKSNNSDVSTNFFCTEEHSNISAILYSESSLKNRPAELGSDYVVVHNPFAVNPIVEGFFKFGVEYLLNQDSESNTCIRINSYRKLDFLYEDTI